MHITKIKNKIKCEELRNTLAQTWEMFSFMVRLHDCFQCFCCHKNIWSELLVSFFLYHLSYLTGQI